MPKESYYRKWKRECPEKFLESRLKFSYGITLDQFKTLLEDQEGLCAICRQPETLTWKGKAKRLHVDHDHATGQVRGILCNRCNTGLGHFADNPALLEKAVKYLKSAPTASLPDAPG